MPSAAVPGGLATFQNLLIGTWANQALPNATGDHDGSQAKPLSYNIMPLPQQAAEPGESHYPGFILKNSTIFEVVKFNSRLEVAVPATAPNRGYHQSQDNPDAIALQVPTALFYQQQVYFADGPGVGTGPGVPNSPNPGIVHVENGSWLNLLNGTFDEPGPYAKRLMLDPAPEQPMPPSIAKQMSVPHGNSILATGSFSEPGPIPSAHFPSVDTLIPDTSRIPPQLPDQEIAVYFNPPHDQVDDYQNPIPDWCLNPNIPLQIGVGFINPNYFITWHVATAADARPTNIPFEEKQARVAAYAATYWLLSNDGGSTYPWLAYSQNITLELLIKGTRITFPHWTSNLLTKQS